MQLEQSHTQGWLGSIGESDWKLRLGSNGSLYSLLYGNNNSQWAMPQGSPASYPCYCLKIIAVIFREQCSIRGGHAGVHVAGGVLVSGGFKGRITKQKARVGSHISFGKQLGQKPALLVNTSPPAPTYTHSNCLDCLLWVQIQRGSPVSLGHFNTGKGTLSGPDAGGV